MSINFETLKMGFKAYLESLEKESSSDEKDVEVDISAVSIFTHSQEFKEYVSDELDINISDIPMDLSELMNMEIVNGQLVNKEEIEGENDTNKTQNNLMASLLNDLFKETEVIKKLDNNGDNSINTEEANNFFNFISGNDKNEKNISLNDIFTGLDQLKEGKYDPKSIENAEEEEEIKDTNKKEIPQSTGNNNGGSFNYNNNTNNQTQKNEEKNYENLSLEELSSTKTNFEKQKESAKDLINGIHSGENAAIKAAKESLDEKKNAYDEAIKNDEKVSNELKRERESNLKNIEDKEKSINSIKINLNNKDNEIAKLENDITSKNSDLSALQNSLSSLQSATTDDPKIQAQIAAQKQTVQTQIADTEKSISELEKKKTNLEKEKKDIEDKLKKEEASLEKLETERTDIESKISENCDDKTKLALQEFNTAKTSVENIKNKELKNAQDLLSKSEAEIDKINTAYNTKNAKKIEKDNHVSTSKLFDGKSNLVAQKVNNKGTMPYILIGPENADPNEELPVLVYMHGSGEVGGSQDTLLRVGPGGIVPNWNLEDFNGYIICPQLTGSYNTGKWTNQRAEGYLRDLLADFEKDHAIDKDNVAVAGHSLGGMGALYMAKHMDDVFTKAAVISGYNVGIDTRDIDIPIVGYVGTQESNEPMNQLFRDTLGEDYLIKVEANHGGAPTQVFNRDTDGNGRSDIIEWLFNDKDYKKDKPD